MDMGVGVYSNDFQGTGGTFIVSGPLNDDQDENQLFYEDMLQVLYNAGRDLGIVRDLEGEEPKYRASFDTDFVGVMEAPKHGVGVRSWEHDFIVGVGARERGEWQDMLANRDSYATQIIEMTGRSPEAFEKLCSELSDNLLTYMRLSLQEAGLECRFRTSGYTTQEYPLEKDGESMMVDLIPVIQEQIRLLDAPIHHGLREQSEEERAQTMKAIFDMPAGDRWTIEKSLGVAVPLYLHKKPEIMWVDPIEARYIGTSPLIWEGTDVDLAKIMADAPQEGGVSAIPRNEATEPWFQFRQALGSPANPNMLMLITSADEYSDAVGEDLIIQYDAEGCGWESDNEITLSKRKQSGLRPK
jgi:hypothetical protein